MAAGPHPVLLLALFAKEVVNLGRGRRERGSLFKLIFALKVIWNRFFGISERASL